MLQTSLPTYTPTHTFSEAHHLHASVEGLLNERQLKAHYLG